MKTYRVRERLHENLLDHLLLARGIESGAHENFLNPDYERDSQNPFLLPDMEQAVERLLVAKKNGEKVCVWSDYDADGTTGGVMLSQFLHEWGLEVLHYIPHRHKEGYGLNIEGLRGVIEQGARVVITVDLGTTEHEQIAFANEQGVDVIVTDHHVVKDASHLPDALAVINPKHPTSEYGFEGLCGAGVAWKLVQAVLSKDRPEGYPEGREKWLLDLVGIATLSDMVPLVGENRMLARNGLLVLRRGRRPGLASLLKLLRISTATLTEDDITFMISPRINAASRMDSPQLAAQMLAAQDDASGTTLALALNRINDERKSLVAQITKEVYKRLKEDGSAEQSVIVLGNPKWRPGVLGLVANKVMEEYERPVFLWGREGGEVLRGSCRSNSVSVVDLMSLVGDVLGHFGGHKASGGFSVVDGRVHELPARLAAAYNSLASSASLTQEVLLDRELNLAELSAAERELRKLSPFGVGNEKPLFIFPQVSIVGARVFGKQQNHLELSLERDGARAVGVSFFATTDTFTKKITPGERADVVGNVELDWRGSPRLRVVDIL